MSSAANDARIDRIVARYQKPARTKAFPISQINGILAVLQYIGNRDEEELGTDWDLLLETMRADYTVATPFKEDDDLTCYEPLAFEKFQNEPWTAHFVTYARDFYIAVQNFNVNLQEKREQRRTKGRKRGYMSYVDMQQTYIRLLQHVFDVPTLDDRNRMGYEPLKDPSGVQPLLQTDEQWQHLLNLAGSVVMWAAYMNAQMRLSMLLGQCKAIRR